MGRGARSWGSRMVNSRRPAGWTLRPFCMADHQAVHDLWRIAGPGVNLRPSDSAPEVAKKLTRDPDLFLVAELRGDIVGVIMGAWDGRRGWLHHLAVAPRVRRLGVASALVAAVEERLRQKGCLKVNLLMFDGNDGALSLYEQLGYSRMDHIIALGKTLQGPEN